MLNVRIFTLLLLLTGVQATLAQEPLPDAQTSPAQNPMPTSFADAEALSEYLSTRIASYFSAIEDLSADKQLIETVLNANSEELLSLQTTLQTALPDSLKVRLYPIGQEKADYEDAPACGYACIKTIQSAYQIPPRAEALLYKTREANLTLVRAIYDDNSAIGAIVVHYPYSILQEAIKKLSADTGLYAEFRQSYSGIFNVLFPVGDSSIKQGPAQQTTRIAGTRWYIGTWTPGGVAIEDYEPPSLPILPIAAGLIVLILGVAVIIARLRHNRKKRPPPLTSGAKDSAETGSESKHGKRTVVMGGGATDVDVGQYLSNDDITDLKSKLDD